MAEEALKKLEDQLNCSVCLDTYTDPKQLHCNHVYCQKCLVKLVIREQGQLVLTCPICRHVTPVPANGVTGLQSAFHINHLLEIQQAVRKICDHSPPTGGEAVGGAVSESPSGQDVVVKSCSEHSEHLKLYCETCEELICFHCIMKTGKHHSHDYTLLNEAFEKYKGEIVSSLGPMEKQLLNIDKALAQLDTYCGVIAKHQEVIEDKVHEDFRQLQQILDSRKTEVIDQLHQMVRDKLKTVALQKDQLETTQAQLSSCFYFVKESLKTGNQEDVLTMKKTIVKQVEELSTTFQPNISEPSMEVDIMFSPTQGVAALCKNYGQIFVPSLPDPSKCHVTGKDLETAVCRVGETSTVVLQTNNFDGHPCKKFISLLACELVSELTSTRTQASVERRGQSQYDISYQPTVKGMHQLHITINTTHVRGSPFSIAVKSPVENLDTPLQSIGGVQGPWGVAINQSGLVVLTEHETDCVSILKPNGQRIRSFGSHGSSDGQFMNVKGVGVDGDGNILVADSKNHRIQKFTAEGQFLAAVGTKGIIPFQFDSPSDIAYNASNSKVYVADTCNHRVQILNPDLTFFGTFGRLLGGSSKGQFNTPYGIACDNSGKVYVADTGNHRVQVFTAEGKFLRMIGRRGEGKGELNRPIAIFVDGDGALYVSEYNNHRVSVFTSEGKFVSLFGREGKGPGQLRRPIGLAVDNSGVVYVCDGRNNRIQAF